MDLMAGQIMLSALSFAPVGTFACNGQIVSSTQGGALLGVLGNAYGGDSPLAFGIPNIPPVQTTSGATLSWLIVADGVPWDSGMEAAVGECRLLPAPPSPGSTLATTWAPCSGAILDIAINPELFALLGNQFGGDGVTTFALPRIAPIAVSNGPPLTTWICLSGYWPAGDSDSVTPAFETNPWQGYLGTVLQLPYATQQNRLDGVGLCLGQTLLISQWVAMFSLLGTRFGGNGTSTFQLPNRPAGADLMSYAIVIDGYYPERASTA